MSGAFEKLVSKEEREEIDEMEQRCRENMAKCEAKWKAEGKIFAWFNKEPDWAHGSLNWFWLEDPKEPCRQIFRFSMIGGGQIKTTQIWDWRRDPHGRPIWPDGHTWKDDTSVLCEIGDVAVTVTPHTSQGVHRYRGTVVNIFGDCSASAVVFGGNVQQDVAECTAATLKVIGPDEEVFYALLDGSEGCAICRRPLLDEISKLIGVGPDCAQQNNIPHSMAAASRRLELRHKLLGEQSQTVLC
jgi:hypothetical protein